MVAVVDTTFATVKANVVERLNMADHSLDARQRLSLLVKSLCENRSQRELANRLGVSHAAISDWINLKTWPSTQNLESLAKASGYTLTELLSYLSQGAQPQPLTLSRILSEINSLPAEAVAEIVRYGVTRLAECAHSYQESA